MHQRLTELFRRREIDKRYWAVVKGVPEPRQGIVNMPLAEVELGDGRHRITGMLKTIDGYQTCKEYSWDRSTEFAQEIVPI